MKTEELNELIKTCTRLKDCESCPERDSRCSHFSAIINEAIGSMDIYIPEHFITIVDKLQSIRKGI